MQQCLCAFVEDIRSHVNGRLLPSSYLSLDHRRFLSSSVLLRPVVAPGGYDGSASLVPDDTDLIFIFF
jgi:hypothetical protein